MILHFLTDDFFADYAITQFRDTNSQFVCIDTAGKMDMVKLREDIHVIHRKSPELIQLIENIEKYDAIILHGMHWGEWQSEILRKVPEKVKVAWVLWGGDIYGRHDVKDNFLAPITHLINQIRNQYRETILHKSMKGSIAWEIPLALYQRVDYCLTSQQEQFDYVKKFTGAKFQHLWYTYFSLDEMLGEVKNKKCYGNGVWLGHCAIISNNYFDTMLKLRFSKNKLQKNQTVIIPLSYGEPWLQIRLTRVARFLYGKRATILSKMLPRNEYNELMLQCSTMIMPSYMSQGMGNIITGLWLGMRVYMSKKNISFAFLRRIGIFVFSLEEDFSQYGYTPLEDEVVNKNRQILQDFYGSKHIADAVNAIVNTLEKK